VLEVIPAIDIRGGRCVRLTQGDYARETVYDADPVAVAQRWVEQGARRLHIVDLDGAREGRPVNHALIAAIARAVTPVPVQCGGGVRDAADALRLQEAGIDRVVIGTAAIEDRALVELLVQRLGDAFAVSIDARDGVAMVRGWQRSGGVAAVELAAELAALGVPRFVYTDIARDGMLEGPNVAGLRAFIAAAGRPVIASGGIAALDHLRAAAAAGAEAAIVGKALYTGALALADALAAVEAAEQC
jgi:phosphoribosylformimino-5-aminoimidazole carboxamide ribotide isomerase